MMSGCFSFIFVLLPTYWVHRYDENPSSPPSRQLCIPPLCLICITTDDRLIPEGRLWTFLLLTSLKVKAQIWLWKKPSSLFRDKFKLSRILILPVTLISL